MTDAEFRLADDLKLMEDCSSKYESGSLEDEDLFPDEV
jgi:hypothetical protein